MTEYLGSEVFTNVLQFFCLNAWDLFLFDFTDKSHNLYDFLSSGKLPKNTRNNLQVMRDKKLPLKQRWRAFNDISKKGDQVSEGEKQRYWYRVVAEECLKLAAAEIEVALTRSPKRGVA
jgi:hypothetical protein